MTRTLTITVNEWESVRDGHLWIVRNAYRTYLNLRAISSHPPADLLAAAAPCETCGGSRRLWHIGTVATGPSEWRGCPDCRITLVGECPTCADRAEWCRYGDGLPDDNPACSNGNITLGYAYPVGEALPIYGPTTATDPYPRIQVYNDGVIGIAVTPGEMCQWPPDDTFAHYGDPAGLVGKWALELREVES